MEVHTKDGLLVWGVLRKINRANEELFQEGVGKSTH